MDMVEWPKARYGEFYSGDSFVMLYTYLINGRENFIIYFWQGLESSQVILLKLIFLLLLLWF
jgi:advillin